MACLTGAFAYKIDKSGVAVGEAWNDVQTLPASVNGTYYLNLSADWDKKDTAATFTLNVFYGGLGGTLVTTVTFNFGDSSTSLSFVYDGITNGDLTVEVDGAGIIDMSYKGDCLALPDPSTPTDIFEETCFIVKDVCKCPTFLIWKHTTGGYRYWLFEYKKTTTQESNRGNELEIYNPYLSSRETVRVILDSAAEDTIALKAKFLESWEYNYLKSIAYAPAVYLLINPDTYLEEGAIVKQVLIDSDKFVAECEEGKKEAELIIRVPEVNTVKRSI